MSLFDRGWYLSDGLNGNYPPENLLPSSLNPGSPWLLPDARANMGFIVDRGCGDPFNTIVLANPSDETLARYHRRLFLLVLFKEKDKPCMPITK